MAQLGHRSERMTIGVYSRAVRQGRTSARSRRREALREPVLSANGHPALEDVIAALDEEGA